MSLWLAKDQKSNEVAALQNALNAALKSGKKLDVDGDFGKHTETAVVAFQNCHGLKPDGIAGPITLGKLFKKADVTVRIRAEQLEPESVAVGSPYSPPAYPPLPTPRKPDDPSSGAFSRITSCWFSNQRLILDYLAQQAPKAPLPAPPPPSSIVKYYVQHPPFMLPQVVGPPVKLSQYRPFESRELLTKFLSLMDFEVASLASYKPVKQFELEFTTSVIFSPFDKWLTAGASAFITPDRKWGLRADLSLVEWELWKSDWGKTVLGNPIEAGPTAKLAGSVVWPYLIGHHPELSFSAGMEYGIGWGIGRSGVRCSFGVGAALMLFRPDKVEGEVRPLPFTGVFSANFKCIK